jgi:hypothetical protein
MEIFATNALSSVSCLKTLKLFKTTISSPFKMAVKLGSLPSREKQRFGETEVKHLRLPPQQQKGFHSLSFHLILSITS